MILRERSSASGRNPVDSGKARRDSLEIFTLSPPRTVPYFLRHDQIPLLDKASLLVPSSSVAPDHVGGSFGTMFPESFEVILFNHQLFPVGSRVKASR